MDDGDRTKLELEVDRDLVARAEAAGLDLAECLERALAAELAGSAARIDSAERKAIGEALAWYDEHVERNGLLSDGWRKFA